MPPIISIGIPAPLPKGLFAGASYAWPLPTRCFFWTGVSGCLVGSGIMIPFGTILGFLEIEEDSLYLAQGI